jgi:hypothetical protein
MSLHFIWESKLRNKAEKPIQNGKIAGDHGLITTDKETELQNNQLQSKMSLTSPG